LSLSYLPATIASLVFCLEPVVAALVSAWLLHERLSPLQYAGGALVIFAVIVTVLARDRRPRQSPA
ncbi:MAG: EamA family transporter, partial [Beijerinckiaceae bacterium]